MRRSFVCACMLVSSLFAFGCMHGNVSTDEAQLGRLPMSAKQEVFTAQNNVQVAQANLAAAERGVRDAKQFGEVANHEQQAANSRLKAAREAFGLARATGSDDSIRSANMNIDLAQKQVIAARAKKDYAAHLYDLRRAEQDLAQRQVDEANTSLSLARADVLRRNNLAPREDVASLERARSDRRFAVDEQERRVATLREEVSRDRISWDEQRRTYDVASRTMTPPPVQPEQPPAQLNPLPLPEQQQPAPAGR